jgi:gluconate 2-dehydrogenase gamma chain
MRNITRRAVLQRTLLSGAASLVAPPLAAGGNRPEPPLPLLPPPDTRNYVYFTGEESAFVEAAVARIIPADELGPGAREAGVSYFIDSQLAGPYGRASRWYMEGPWKDGATEQGYQLSLTPAQLYRAAIRQINEFCRKSNGRKVFAELDASAQDKLLGQLENGKVELSNGASATDFFDMLVQNTTEGFLADPMYGGNRNFIGWKLIGFPGPRYDYGPYIEKYGRRYPLPPVSLLGRRLPANQES